MARSFSFETLSRREIARIRKDAQEPYLLVGYEDTESRPFGMIGDDVGPYVHMIGRASSDGESATPEGIPAVADGESQRILVDAYGRIWANVTVNIPPTEVQNVQGNIANGEPDAGSFPVKVGGIAVANGEAGALVDAGDRVDAAYSLNGAQHVLTSPNPLTDATTYVYTTATSAAGDASGRRVVKATPGRLRRAVFVNNDPSNTLYAQVHNTNAVGTIATGTLVWPGIPVPANGGVVEVDFSEADLPLTAGIALALSTAQGTYTAAAVTGFTAAQYA